MDRTHTRIFVLIVLAHRWSKEQALSSLLPSGGSKFESQRIVNFIS